MNGVCEQLETLKGSIRSSPNVLNCYLINILLLRSKYVSKQFLADPVQMSRLAETAECDSLQYPSNNLPGIFTCCVNSIVGVCLRYEDNDADHFEAHELRLRNAAVDK